MICWDYSELSTRELRAFSHQLLPFIFQTLLPGEEEEEEACFILPTSWLGKLDKIWWKLFHPDGNLGWNLESGSFPVSILMDKCHIAPFCRTLPAAKPLKETVIRDWIQTFDSRKGRDSLAETSRALGKQCEKSHLPFISGELQGGDGSGTTLLTLQHFPQLSEELIILWDKRQFQTWLLTSQENIQGSRPRYFMFLLEYLTQCALN